MERFKNCEIKLNKELIKRHIKFKYGSIKNYLKCANITKTRFWQIINQPHLSTESPCIVRLAKDLDLTTGEIIL